MAGMLGKLPTSAASSNSSQSGPRQWAQASRANMALALLAAATGSTLRWPWRSTRAEMRGASTAIASAKQAAAVPASV